MSALEAAAAAALRSAFGEGGAVHTAQAPGRCTLVGEHVDYNDGLVLCAAVDLGVAVAARPSLDSRWRAVSGRRRVERTDPSPVGDVGDRPFAVAEALRRRGVVVPPIELMVAADLPEAAGLSSSAALSCATAVALLRMAGSRLGAAEVADVALVAERDIVGVPCGPLDQRAVVGVIGGVAQLLDCQTLAAEPLPGLPAGWTLVAADSGSRHDVGGEGYRTRRAEAAAALRALGATSWRGVDLAGAGAASLGPPLACRARHIVTETARARAAAAALRVGDMPLLGWAMHASHASLRDDYAVSTPQLDAMVTGAEAIPECVGARLVGAGFGGTVIALVTDDAAEACRVALTDAATRSTPGATVGSWRLRLSPGLVVTAADVIG